MLAIHHTGTIIIILMFAGELTVSSWVDCPAPVLSSNLMQQSDAAPSDMLGSRWPLPDATCLGAGVLTFYC
jgi:hypothetical protein